MKTKTDIRIDLNEAKPVHYIVAAGNHFLRPNTEIVGYDDQEEETYQWDGIIQTCRYDWRNDEYIYEILLNDKPYLVAQ